MFKKTLLVFLLVSASVVLWLVIEPRVSEVPIAEMPLDKEKKITEVVEGDIQKKLLAFEGEMAQLKQQQTEREGLLEEEMAQLKQQQAEREGLLEEEMAQLKQQQAEGKRLLEEEMAQLKQQQAEGESFLEENTIEAGDIASVLFEREQKIQEAKIALGNTVQQLNGFLETEVMDEVRAGDLQEKVQFAFSNANLSQKVALASTMCNTAICRFEIFDYPSVESGGKSVIDVLKEQDVFGDSEVLAIPNEESGMWTFYVSPEGQRLPHSKI